MNLLEVTDKTKMIIYLTDERWSHISGDHKEISTYLGQFIATLEYPTKFILFRDKIGYYYKYIKNRNNKDKYLLVIVKYLNGEGFIVTAYFVREIK